MRLKKDDSNFGQYKNMTATIGKVKTGKKSDKGYPTSIDYFRFTVSINGEATDIDQLRKNNGKHFILDRIHQCLEQFNLGNQPKSLPIVFVSDDDNYSCSEQLELYTHSGERYAYTDGHSEVWVSLEKGWKRFTIEDINKPEYEGKYGSSIQDFMNKLIAYMNENAEAYNANKVANKQYKAEFERKLSLKFAVPIFGLLGCFEYVTKSVSSIDQIVNTFDMVKEVNGSVIGVPFMLTVTKVKQARFAQKKRTYPVVNLIPVSTKENPIFNKEVLESSIKMIQPSDVKQIDKPNN